jgi:hypothetical protein
MGDKKPSDDKDAQALLAQHRLTVLELAETLGNVAEACRRHGMDRSSFYKWKRRYAILGLDGLKDFPPVHNAHPQATPPDVVEMIKRLSMLHPGFGCNKIQELLVSKGHNISSVTVHKILEFHSLNTKESRWKKCSQNMLTLSVI